MNPARKRSRRLGYSVLVVFCFAVALAPMRELQGQCDTGWEPGVLAAPHVGANGPINAIISWGLPAQPQMLIVGGGFTEIGGIAATNIAAWDGSRWRALGDGLDDTVHSLAIFNLALVAGGRGFIEAWNGSEWATIGTPDTDGPGEDPPPVLSLTNFNGYLYAGGTFDVITPKSGVPDGGCMYYDGTVWRGIDTHRSFNVLQVFDDDGPGSNPPALYMGGDKGYSYGHFRKTVDGTTTIELHGIDGGIDGDIHAMTVVDPMGGSPGGLIIGGDFCFLRYATGDIQAGNIVGWTGSSWFTLGGGIGDGPYSCDNAWVTALRAYGSHLYVGGHFEYVQDGTVPALNIARWNGSTWSSVGGGVSVFSSLNYVREMRVIGGALVVGGYFSTVDGGAVSARYIAQWNGVNWSAFNEYPTVQAAAYLGSRLVLGGAFSHWTQADQFAPIVNRYNLLTWDGATVGGAGWGTNGPVNALVGYASGSGATAANNLVVAGSFSVVGGGFEPGGSIAVSNVARWSEPALTPAQWNTMGSGFNNAVYVLDRFNGNTVAGGAFTASGGTTLNRLAKWNGSAWAPLTASDIGLNGAVYAMKSYSTNLGTNFHLVIGGDFTSAPGSGVGASRVLQRSEGIVSNSWVALGSGFNGTVLAIERHANSTYAGGLFTHSGATQLNRIGRWNGSAWVPVGTGTGFNGPVYALRSLGGFLYAAGVFTNVDGVPVNNLARWNGSAWSSVSGGANAPVFALLPYKSELIAGGAFSAVESGTVSSTAMARLKASGVPWLSAQPESVQANCQGWANFELEIVDGYPNVTYQWRKDGAPLTDGPTGNGSMIGGADSAALLITNARPADAGSYDCVVSNDCGSVTSIAATLTVEECCVGDVNFDNVVDVFDLLAVLGAWGRNPGHPADTNGDDVVDVIDLLNVLGGWGACS